MTDNNYDIPTLIYPIGGEDLSHETVQIQWEEPVNLALQSLSSLDWYEILFSIDSENEESRYWRTIAIIPVGNSIFDWNPSHNIRSDKCRIGIRSISHTGSKSSISMSASNFSIQNRRLPTPAILSPLDNDVFFSYIPVTFDQAGLAGQSSIRAHYRISYSSNSQGVDWTCLSDNLPTTTVTTYLDVSSFNSANDYMFKFELIDGENSSSPFFVRDVTINNLNFFKIDTTPPSGSIEVKNNEEYINNRNVIVELSSYDATSGTESFRIIQKEIDNDDADTTSPLYPITDFSSWRIVNDDGVKLIQVSFVDYAGNALEIDVDQFFFKTFKSVDNRKITSLLVSKDESSYNVWMAVGGIDPELYLNGSSVVGAEAVGTLNYLPTNVSGTQLNYEQRYNVEGLGSIDVNFNAFSTQDRMIIEGGDVVLKDTGLISGEESFNLSIPNLDEIVVKIVSNSADSSWQYSIDSINEYPINSDFYNTSASQDKPAGEVLSMSIYNDVLYLGVETREAKGLLQRYAGSHIELVYQLDTLDSTINSMIVFDNKLFLACRNGELYSFNGSNVLLENSFEDGLHKIGTDGNLLYIFLNNSKDIYIAYKNSFDNLVYTKRTLT